ncbi:MAG: right-handed parallel beta-helix repeat-containing protein [Verrucomicrobiota bacterium]
MNFYRNDACDRRWSAPLAGLLWGLGLGTTLAAGLTLHVSPQGKDGWSGLTASPNAAQTDGPLASLEGARDALRRMRSSGHLPAGAVTVQFQSGRYEQLAPVVFKAEDSGTAASPVVFTAAPRAQVRLTGGVELRQFHVLTDERVLRRLPAAARGKVQALSLSAQGLHVYGVEPVGASAAPASGIQLIYGDDVMTLARWPNEGYVQTVDTPDGPKGNTFTYAGDNPSRWAEESDPHGQGYWAYDWAACAIAFDKIDPATKTITQKVPGSNYGFRKGGFWFGYNLLCELDQPGEYYVDRPNGNLYFWPPAKPANTRAEVSVGTRLLQLDNATHLQFRGLTFENCRGAAIAISQGEAITVAGCTLRNLGDRAITIRDGKSHRIAGCEMYQLGDGGIMSVAGNEQTLEHCGHVYDNNHIHDYARFSLTYGAAIQVNGCGHRVAHNLIHDGPHVAVLFGGRENLFEYNEIHSVCLSSGEMGAFYTGRNWTLVGNAINGNFIHDIYNPRQQRNRAIMLDDGAAGIRITNNLIVRVAEGISLSAVDNTIDNNVFVDCHPAISGWQTWAKPEDFAPNKWSNAQMLEQLAKVPVDAAPWKDRYPQLAMLRDAIRDHKLRAPETRTRVEHNVIWGGPPEWMVHYKAYPPSTDTWQIGANNLAGVDPLFVDPAKGDYRLQPQSPAFKAGFKALPVDMMGLYDSPERAVWPVTHQVRMVSAKLTADKP